MSEERETDHKRQTKASEILRASASICWLILACCTILPGQQNEPAKTENEALIIECSPEAPIVWKNQSIRVKTWVLPTTEDVQYSWAVKGGRKQDLEDGGRVLVWSFKGFPGGHASATVSVRDRAGRSTECRVEVISSLLDQPKGPGSATRLSRWSFLGRNESEQDGYGLYSYLLFGSKPDQESKERYLKAIQTYLRCVPNIMSLEQDGNVNKSQLNILYLPVLRSPEGPPGTDLNDRSRWALDNYDYVRSQRVLAAIGRADHLSGPYVVSYFRPITKRLSASEKLLFQDLSHVDPELVPVWIEELLAQAAQERWWDENTCKRMMLKLISIVRVAADSLPPVKQAIASWIVWTSSVSK